MSNEFYKAISNRLITFLRNSQLSSGDRFWLRLDNQEMIEGIREEIICMLKAQNALGEYRFINEFGEETYVTHTLDLPNNKRIVFVYQREGMQTDFFATMRNRILADGNISVSLALERLDTVGTATTLLSDPGMPFNQKELRKSVLGIIEGNTFSPGERALLSFALQNMEEDRYSDKSSVSGYETFLSIAQRGGVVDEDFFAFKLFPVKTALSLCKRSNDKKISDLLKDNAAAFEQIEIAFSRDEIRDRLSSYYKKSFVDDLLDKKAKEEAWYTGLTYADILNGKRSNPNDKIVELSEEPSEAYYEVLNGSLLLPLEDLLIKTEGDTKAARRKKHIVVFAPKDADKIQLKFRTTSPVQKAHLKANKDLDPDSNFKMTQSSVTVLFRCPTDVTFKKAIIQKNYLNIAVVKTRSKFFKGIETRYTVDCKKNNKSSILVDVERGEFVINPSGKEEITEQVVKDKLMTCFDNQKLLVKTDESEMDSSESNIAFKIVCDGCYIPFSVKLDIAKKRKIDATGIYREKNITKKSFKKLGKDRLQLGTNEYVIDEQLTLYRLDLEVTLAKNHWLSARFNNSSIEERELSVPDRLRDAYFALFDELSRMDSCLTLAYVGDKHIGNLVTECIDAYIDCLSQIKEGDHSFEPLLEIGMIFDDQGSGEILLSPYHPVNLAYQMNLLSIGSFDREDSLTNVALAKLIHHQAIPYIFYGDKYYEVADITALQEWVVYYEVESERSRALGDVVSRVVRERIGDFLNHFGFLFKNNIKKPLRVACYDLGSCEGILTGITEFLFRSFYDHGANAESVIPIHVDCYGDPNIYTAFENLLDKATLEQFLSENSLLSDKPKDVSDSECVALLLGHLSFSLHKSDAPRQYAHLAFIPGPAKQRPMPGGIHSELNTGVMLNGAITSAATTDPGEEGGGWFNTGFGSKDMSANDFSRLITRVNMLHSTAYTPSGACDNVIQAAVSKKSEESYNSVYDSANWVVLLDPKIDPMHFAKANESSRPLVIHYEDREASNGYDAITVTKKTSQYEAAISEAFNGASCGDISQSVQDVVSFANAFNGTWLLSFLKSKKSQTPRSRMSTLASVKAMMSHYGNQNILWVPLSLEEILRVSNGLKLSAATEINSWKNLGFGREPMSDDVLLVGITGNKDHPQVVLHPIEVKVGNCTDTEIQKGIFQAEQTYQKIMGKFWGDVSKELLSTKIARNSFMQKVLISAEKMDAYGVLPEIDWTLVLEGYRMALQNEDYDLVSSAELNMPIGTVCAFATGKASTEVETRGNTRVLFVPETKIPEVTVGSFEEVSDVVGRYDFNIPFTPGDPISDAMDDDSSEEVTEWTDESDMDTSDSGEASSAVLSNDNEILEELSAASKNGIIVDFGENLENGERVLWEPCNTSKLFHTNTGIIGTMGTGKTQFTKSLITQIYRNRKHNPFSSDVGILIFDYKGDYNKRQTDFVASTNAMVYKPWKLPFNPLSINRSDNSLPLLPKHIANTFKDTLVRACSASKMGAIQENTLRRVIMDAYELKQINPADPSTWDREPPTFETVYRLYQQDEDIKKNDTLASMMEKLHDFEIFESEPSKTLSLFDALKGVVVIDLSGYDQDIQNLVVGIMVDLFYSQMHAVGHSSIDGNMRELSKMILVDEADNFLSQGFPSLKKILKEGREFGVGVILSTQFLTHFKSKEEDYSKYILTWVVHNVSDLDPSDIRFVFNTVAKSDEEEYYFNQVKKLSKHCSLVKMGENSKPVPMRDLAFFELVIN